MNRNLLQKGDVIRLTKGMKVYALIPEMFVYSNRTSSTGVAKTDIRIGEIRSSQFSMSNNIKETLSLFGMTINDDEVAPFIDGLGLNLSFDTSKFEGEYTVTYAVSDGGGTGMGLHDVYPIGYHVFCEKKDNPSIQVDFYQTGAFTAMIAVAEIQPLNR